MVGGGFFALWVIAGLGWTEHGTEEVDTMRQENFFEWVGFRDLADHCLDALAEYARSGELAPEWRAPIEEAREFCIAVLQGRRMLETMQFLGWRRGVLEAWEWAHDVIKVLRKEEHVVEFMEAEVSRYLALLDLLLILEKPVFSREDSEALTVFFKALRQVAMARQERERQERNAERDPFGSCYRACAVA
ncbi:hypothetical protein HYZ80_01475 [Candidatus Parcubacteria bacterium]|nr:hypothetical protein [Candidatus Parcubacteria bacterium]